MSAWNKFMCDAENIHHSVRYITIKDENALDIWSKSFPNVTELTVDSSLTVRCPLFTTDALRHTISVTHLQKLTLTYLNFNQVVDALLYVPNIHTLSVIGISTNANEISTLRKSEKFRLVSEKNKIKHVIIKTYSLTTIKMLIDLCPELQHLSVNSYGECFMEMADYILSKSTRRYSGIFVFGTRVSSC